MIHLSFTRCPLPRPSLSLPLSLHPCLCLYLYLSVLVSLPLHTSLLVPCNWLVPDEHKTGVLIPLPSIVSIMLLWLFGAGMMSVPQSLTSLEREGEEERSRRGCERETMAPSNTNEQRMGLQGRLSGAYLAPSRKVSQLMGLRRSHRSRAVVMNHLPFSTPRTFCCGSRSTPRTVELHLPAGRLHRGRGLFVSGTLESFITCARTYVVCAFVYMYNVSIVCLDVIFEGANGKGQG